MTNNVLMVGGRKTAAHRDATLVARYELATAFLTSFSRDGDNKDAFTVDEFDQWGVNLGRMASVPVDAPSTSPEWIKRLHERAHLKRDVNFGGKCDLFPSDKKFQIDVVINGTTYRIVPLMDQVNSVYNSMPEVATRAYGRVRRELELLVNSIGVDNMTAIVKASVISALKEANKNERLMQLTLEQQHESLLDLIAMIEANNEGAITHLIDGPFKQIS